MKFLKRFITFVIVMAVLGVGGYFAYTKTDLFSNTYTVSFDAAGGTYLEECPKTLEVEKGSTITLPEIEREGYTFDGWYMGSVQWDELKPVKRDIKLVAKWTPIKYKITFVVDGTYYESMQDYDSTPVFSGNLQKDPTATQVFTFSGWEPQISAVKGEATYTAVFSESERFYKIQVLSSIEDACDLAGGGEFKFYESTTVNVLPKSGYTFEGWYLNGELYTTNQSFTIDHIISDMTFVARWEGDEKNITFSVDGISLSNDTMTTSYGTTIVEPEIDCASYGMSGFIIDGWYIDEACTQKYTFANAPLHDLKLYGKWKYVLDNGFYAYLSKFKAAQIHTPLTIKSLDELVAWVEYIQFYNITTRYPLNLSFSHSGIMATIEKAVDLSIYPSNASTAWTSDGKYGRVFIDTDSPNYRSNEYNLKVADQDKSETYVQQQFAYAIGNVDTRAENYENFNIYKVVQTLEVDTTNQLVYALEVGLKPVCKAGSPAEAMMNKAKQVLRDICADSMDDVTKLRAIYEWLILNVSYDHEAANLAVSNHIAWEEYDAWYIEGVFNNGKAVCDGIAKAFLVLARLENIATIRISGLSAEGLGHAWNKVYVDGKWFGVDATHGDIGVSSGSSGLEVLSYANFMFTDAFKESGDEPYYATDYLSIKAETEYNIYDEVSYTYESSQFDWYINTQAEYLKALQYVKSKINNSTTTYCVVELAIDKSLTYSNLESYASMYGFNCQSLTPLLKTTNEYSVYTLLFY